MPENDKSRPLKDHPGRKTTRDVEGDGRQTKFFAQSSALSPYFFETGQLVPESACGGTPDSTKDNKDGQKNGSGHSAPA